MKTTRPCLGLLVALVAGIGCSATSGLAEIQGFGPNPVLPPPTTSLLPTTNVVKAIGWQADATPTAAPGSTVVAFARDLDHPRWLYVLPNGDVLVAETNGPPGAGNVSGIRRWFYNRYQQKSGNATPSANRITLLRDADGDGVAETRVPFLTGLRSPLGMALIGDTLYIANHDAVVRVPYTRGATQIAAAPVKVVDLPSLPPEHHWTKNIIASADGLTLYAAVGSNSNVAEEGLDKEVGRAAIWALDLASGSFRMFASGLRNPVGMAWVEESGLLWTAVNERDELGNDLVPDYITSVRQGGFYGWPYSYFGSHVDERVKPQRPELVATALVPDYAVGSHTASLGLAYSRSNALPEPFQNGMFIGQHGSWNRKPRSGFKVIFVPFSSGRPSGLPIDVLTGFVTADGDAMGRPVGVALDARGGLLVADDVGNAVWRVTGAGRLRGAEAQY